MVLEVKNPSANAGDIRGMGLMRGSGKHPGGGCSNPPQYSRLENRMDRKFWQATVHSVAKTRTHTQCINVNLIT